MGNRPVPTNGLTIVARYESSRAWQFSHVAGKLTGTRSPDDGLETSDRNGAVFRLIWYHFRIAATVTLTASGGDRPARAKAASSARLSAGLNGGRHEARQITLTNQ